MTFNSLACIFLFNIAAQDIYAFDWKQCTSQKLGSLNMFGVSTSSSQFTSSSGGCSMVGAVEHDKQVFLTQNFENLKIDSSRGTGEYIEAFAVVSMCNKWAKNELSGIFQKKFTYIYGDMAEKEPEQVYKAMERVMKMNPILLSGCN